MSASPSSQSPPPMPAAELTPEEFADQQEKADEYKETWLKMWSNSTNPKQMSCVTAFDIVAWCFGPVNQCRHVYRTGAPTLCTEQFDDLKLCLKVLAKSGGDDTEARELLRADRRSKEDKRPHIFKMRTEPPIFFQDRSKKTAPTANAAAATANQ